MRVLLSLALVASLALVTACTRESEPGGPGVAPGPVDAPATAPRDTTEPAAVPRDTTAPTTQQEPMTDRDETDRRGELAVPGIGADPGTFTLQAPVTAQNIEQGGSENINLTLNRGRDFGEAVTLTFQAPAGLSVSPEQMTIEAAAEEANITVQADAAAAVGRHQIAVTATPQTGRAVEMVIEVDVTQP